MHRYGYDLHGSVDRVPMFYRDYFQALIEEQLGEIWIVSGPPAVQIEKELKDLGFEKGVNYTASMSIVDFLRARGCKMWQDDKGNWWASDEDWWSSKALICKDCQIDVMLDNNGKYAPYFEKMGLKFELLP